MRHLQTWFKNAYDYSCLAQCYLYAIADHSKIGIKEKQLELFITSSLTLGYGIDDEFFVSDPVSLMTKSWKEFSDEDVKVNVRKMDLKEGLSELKTIPYAAVRFDYNGHSHYVLMKYGMLEYNSLEESNCFKYGKPTTARIIEFED